jgi:hypothetical protein
MFATLTTPSPGWTSPGLTYDRALERTHTRAAGGALPQFEDRRPFASKKRRRQTTTPPRGKRGAATQPAPDMVPGMLLESDFHLNRLGMQCEGDVSKCPALAWPGPIGGCHPSITGNYVRPRRRPSGLPTTHQRACHSLPGACWRHCQRRGKPGNVEQGDSGWDVPCPGFSPCFNAIHVPAFGLWIDMRIRLQIHRTSDPHQPVG